MYIFVFFFAAAVVIKAVLIDSFFCMFLRYLMMLVLLDPIVRSLITVGQRVVVLVVEQRVVAIAPWESLF
jgi:hypothetical protein